MAASHEIYSFTLKKAVGLGFEQNMGGVSILSMSKDHIGWCQPKYSLESLFNGTVVWNVSGPIFSFKYLNNI